MIALEFKDFFLFISTYGSKWARNYKVTDINVQGLCHHFDITDLVPSSVSGVETAAAWVVALNVALARHCVSWVYGVVKQLWYKPGLIHAVSLIKRQKIVMGSNHCSVLEIVEMPVLLQ